MTLPSDPEKLTSYYMLAAQSKALLDVFDFITDIQTFRLETIHPEGSIEFKAVADALEGVKQAVLLRQGVIAHQANSLLEQ